ncbi:hypothetical protein Droror1_Dr00024430 [Drosera rotundifolia]
MPPPSPADPRCRPLQRRRSRKSRQPRELIPASPCFSPAANRRPTASIRWGQQRRSPEHLIEKFQAIQKGTAEAPWRLCDLMENLKHKMELLQAKVQHCFREANMVSDELVTWGLKGCNQIYEKQDQLPRKAKGLLLLDTQALPTLRRTK